MLSKEEERLMEENFAFIDSILERDLGINLHPEEPVYENTETMEELAAWIDEQVHGPVEEKWNDVKAEGVQLIPMEAVRSMVESGELQLEEDGDGFEEDIANRIQDELIDYLNECGYFIAKSSGVIDDITRYTLNEWYSLRPDEFKYYGGGMEWDYVTYAENYLRRNYPRIKVRTFLILHIDENGPSSYPFFMYKVGKKWYYHECAIPDRIKSEVFEDAALGIEKIFKNWKETNGGYTDGMTVIKEYQPYDHHDQSLDELYGSVFEDYRNWMKKYVVNVITESKGKHRESVNMSEFSEVPQLETPSKYDALRELFLRRADLYAAMERGENISSDDMDIINHDIWFIINEGYTPDIMMKYGGRDGYEHFSEICLSIPYSIMSHYGSFTQEVRFLHLEEMSIHALNIVNEEYIMGQKPGGSYCVSDEYKEILEKFQWDGGPRRINERPIFEDATEKKDPKNGVNRKNLYIAFIQYAQRVDSANKFDTNFTKDIFDKKYTNVPDSMRYFYRLADPTQCILNDGLVFFSLKNAQEINKKNSDITRYYIFAGIGDLFFVVDQKNGAVHEATEEQLRHVRVGKKMAPNFDIYIQKLVNNGDYLDGKVVPPDDIPKKEEKDE